MTLRTLNYGNYGIFLIMGSAGFCPSTVGVGTGQIPTAVSNPEVLRFGFRLLGFKGVPESLNIKAPDSV